MDRTISEADWRIYRELHRVALDRFCSRVLDELSQVAADSAKSNHERYLAIYQLVKDRDKELAGIFDSLSRSTALWQLVRFRVEQLVTDEEFSRFSEQARAYVQALLNMR